MNVGGTVVAVSMETDARYANKPGTYKAWQLIYKDQNGQVKEITKSVAGLKFNPALRQTLETLATGDEVTVVQEKVGQFWEIKAIEKGLNTAVMSDTPKPAYSGGKVTGSNYETPQERAARQRLIVRQSSLTAALGYFELTKAKPTVEEVTNLAEELCDFVFEKAPE